MIEPSSITERCGSRRVRIFSEDFVELTKLIMACGGSSLIGYGSGTSVQIFDWLPLQKFQKETTLIQLNYLHGTPKKVYRNISTESLLEMVSLNLRSGDWIMGRLC